MSRLVNIAAAFAILTTGVCRGALLTDFSNSFALYQESTRQPSDFDSDGTVAGADFMRWQRNSGRTGISDRSMGDANRDGRIDKIDLNELKGQFGSAGVPDAVSFKLYFDPQGIVLGEVTAFVDAPDPGGGLLRFGVGLENGISEKHPQYTASIVDSILIQTPGRQRIETKVRFTATSQTSPPIGDLTIFGLQIQDKLPLLGVQGVQVGFDFKPGDFITIRDTDTGQTTTFQDNQLTDVSPTLALPFRLEVNTVTGDVGIRNPNPFTVQFLNYYEILSDFSSLNPAGWESFQDNGVGGWQEAGGANVSALAEANLLGVGETLAAGGLRPLGTAFNPAGIQQLDFNYVAAGNLLVAGDVMFFATSVAVPEPGALYLAIAGVGLCSVRRLVRKRSHPAELTAFSS